MAQAIRTGIFIEKIYQRMSKTQMMVIPEVVGAHLEVSQQPRERFKQFSNKIN